MWLPMPTTTKRQKSVNSCRNDTKKTRTDDWASTAVVRRDIIAIDFIIVNNDRKLKEWTSYCRL